MTTRRLRCLMHNLFIITASKQIEWCRIQVSTFLSVVKLCISSQINCGFSRSPENKVFAAEAVVKLGSCSALLIAAQARTGNDAILLCLAPKTLTHPGLPTLLNSTTTLALPMFPDWQVSGKSDTDQADDAQVLYCNVP